LIGLGGRAAASAPPGGGGHVSAWNARADLAEAINLAKLQAKALDTLAKAKVTDRSAAWR
jgi:hypothetical protein